MRALVYCTTTARIQLLYIVVYKIYMCTVMFLSLQLENVPSMCKSAVTERPLSNLQLATSARLERERESKRE